MHRSLNCFWAFCLCVVACRATAAEPSQPRTLMTQRGKSIFADDLTQTPAQPWRVAKGAWTPAEEAVLVKELKADMHGAVARRPVPHANFIVEYSFKLDGARNTSLSINDAKGHCCRVVIDAAGVSVRKDSHDHNQTDKPAVLDRQATPIAAGQWHTLVVEVLGPEMVASIDDKIVAFGSHPSIDVMKKDIGLTVAGESVSFKNLRVWEASPNPSWNSTKAALAKDRRTP
jgi:hypothetical protein